MHARDVDSAVGNETGGIFLRRPKKIVLISSLFCSSEMIIERWAYALATTRVCGKIRPLSFYFT